jgi:hypothetical protein
VVTERGPIFFEPEAAQPSGHIHRSCSETASLADHYNSSAEFCPGRLRRARGWPKALPPNSWRSRGVAEVSYSIPRTPEGGNE